MHVPTSPAAESGPARFTDDLFKFAWIPTRGDVPASKGYESRLRELADEAQFEPWTFDPANPFEILGADRAKTVVIFLVKTPVQFSDHFKIRHVLPFVVVEG